MLEIRSEILDADDPALATTRNNLASVLQRSGRAKEVRGRGGRREVPW